MEQSFIPDDKVNNSAGYKVSLALSESQTTEQPRPKNRDNVDGDVRDNSSVHNGFLGVLGLHYYALQVTRVIEFLGAQKQEEQDIHKANNHHIFTLCGATLFFGTLDAVILVILSLAFLDVIAPFLLGFHSYFDFLVVILLFLILLFVCFLVVSHSRLGAGLFLSRLLIFSFRTIIRLYFTFITLLIGTAFVLLTRVMK